MSMHDVLSPLADKSQFPEHALDYNVRAERAGLAAQRAAAQHQPAAHLP
jgi:nitrate reductase alpha subunit